MKKAYFHVVTLGLTFVVVFCSVASCKEQTADDLYVSAEKMYEIGRREWSEGRLEKSNEAMKLGMVFIGQAIERKPDEPKYLRLSVNILIALEKYEQALKNANKLVSLEPTLAENYDSRAGTLLLMNKIEESLADYRKAIDLAPDNFYIVTNYCSSLNHVGRHQEAIEACTKAISINEKYPMAYYIRARAYEKLGKSDLSMADDKKAKSLGFIQPKY